MGMLLAQLSMIVMAGGLFWEGSKGFRSCGINLKLSKKQEGSMDPTIGKIVGAIMIALGVLCLVFAFIVFPSFGF